MTTLKLYHSPSSQIICSSIDTPSLNLTLSPHVHVHQITCTPTASHTHTITSHTHTHLQHLTRSGTTSSNSSLPCHGQLICSCSSVLLMQNSRENAHRGWFFRVAGGGGGSLRTSLSPMHRGQGTRWSISPTE